MKHRTISVTEFKAKCLALLDEVGEHGGTITKRGKPLASVRPPEKSKLKSPEGSWAGRIKLPGDLEKWDFSDLYDCSTKGGESF